MKYIVASVVALAIIFLFAIFATVVGWRHGGGFLVQSALWIIVATAWTAIVKGWSYVSSKPHQETTSAANRSFLNDNARFIVLVGVIVIVGLGVLFAVFSSSYSQTKAITGQEFLIKCRATYPDWDRYSDEAVVWALLRDRPDTFRIVRIDGIEWKRP